MLFLLACSDTNLTKAPGGFETAGSIDSDFTPGESDTEETAAPPEEECNGVDDDGDGEVDEGFPDDDANGRVDCLDGTCSVALPDGGPVEQDLSCSAGPSVADPWVVKTLWQEDTPAESHPDADNCAVTPLVAQLGDDNGDGTIDEDDDPDVILNVYDGYNFYSSTLVVLDGATGDHEWEVDGIIPLSGVAVGDIDSDGSVDVVAVGATGQIYALEADGSPKWTTAAVYSGWGDETPITLVDWDGDGQPEVFVAGFLFDGATGAEFENLGIVPQFLLPAFVDLDLDGEYEVLGNGVAYNHDMSVRWTGVGGLYGAWPVAFQADADPEPEIAFASNGMHLYEPDGTLIGDVPAVGGAFMGSPPAVGDFDGDGAPELAWAYGNTMYMVEGDGTVDWTVPVVDVSSYAGASGADLDGDGALEVLYGDEVSFTIFDGRTGATLYQDTNRGSITMSEYPVPVDLDHDGHTEILVPSSGLTGWGAITALTHDGAGWGAAASTWSVQDYNWENVGDDGGVPAAPPNPWLGEDVVRACPANPSDAADLVVTFTDLCVSDCVYGPAEVGVQVYNEGGAAVEAGAVLELYADDVLLATEVLPAIGAATALDTFDFPIAVADVPATEWIARVTTTASECDTTNNEARTGEAVCP